MNHGKSPVRLICEPVVSPHWLPGGWWALTPRRWQDCGARLNKHAPGRSWRCWMASTPWTRLHDGNSAAGGRLIHPRGDVWIRTRDRRDAECLWCPSPLRTTTGCLITDESPIDQLCIHRRLFPCYHEPLEFSRPPSVARPSFSPRTATRPGGDMARPLVVVNSVILLLFGSDMFLVAASEYQPLWQQKMRIYVSIFAWRK